MNARSQVFEIGLEKRQVSETALAIFQTVMFHRSFGKFQYRNDDTFVMGALGFEDVDCQNVDYTYVRPYSPRLCKIFQHEADAFASSLKGGQSGHISLEFFQKRRRWPFSLETVPWEVWTLRTHVVSLYSDEERRRWHEKVGDLIGDKVLYITEVMNRHEYVPKTPAREDLDLVYDTSFTDVQPYLFRLSFSTDEPSSPSMGARVKRLLQDTLAI